MAKIAQLALFELYRAEFLARARSAAESLLADRPSGITVDDVREVCPPPETVDPRVMGAVFRQSQFEKVGYVGSRRTECHHRPVCIFKLKED